MKKIGLLLSAVICFWYVSGCSKNSSTTAADVVPTATAVGVYAEAYIINRTDTTNITAAYVVLRHGNSIGSVITDAAISMNQSTLAYDAVSNSYTSTSIPFAAEGTTATVSITCTAGTLYGSVVIPPYVTVTAPAQNITVSGSTYPFYITITADANPGAFMVVSDKMSSAYYMLSGGSGDVRIFTMSPGLAGSGNVIVTVKSSNTGVITGGVSGSIFAARDCGGQLAMTVN
jgi:hypothetical protein